MCTRDGGWFIQEYRWRGNQDGGREHNTNVSTLVIDPITPATVYAGRDGGGVFKSVDSGANWTAANSGLPDYSEVLALAIDPTIPTQLYVGKHGLPIFSRARMAGEPGRLPILACTYIHPWRLTQ